MPSTSPTNADTLVDFDAFNQAMAQGSRLHSGGELEPALISFEQAFKINPANAQALNACVAVLLDLARPDEAVALMRSREDLVLGDIDTLCNWATLSESVGAIHEAQIAYEKVLERQPTHLRALNNSALLALSRSEWPLASARLQQCCSLAPSEPAFVINLIDCLTAANESSKALSLAEQAYARWPAHPEFELRRAIQLAFNRHFAGADAALASLSNGAKERLQQYLASVSEAAARVGRAAVNTLPDAQELYFIHQFAGLGHCNWRNHDELCDVLRQAISASYNERSGRDWRDVQFYALMLPLEEEEQAQCVRHTYRNIVEKFPTKSVSTAAHRLPSDGRIRVGISLQSLHDARHRNAIENWLTHGNQTEFSYYVYANTPSPQAVLADNLRSRCASFVEINHLSVGDTIKRMRLDSLDVYLDAAFYTPWCRAELPYGRVAPINIRLQSWQRWNSGVYQYVMGDHVTHPNELDRDHWGPSVRLPSTCWLALNNDHALPGVSRASLSLPESCLIFAAFSAPIGIDPHSFALWMEVLNSVPDSVIWFAAVDPGTRANLLREAAAKGISASRILFCNPPPAIRSDNALVVSEHHRAWHLAQLQCADFFLDPLKFGASYTLCDALRAAIPSVSVLGNNLASRLGCSILHAADLKIATLTHTKEYVPWITQWARGGALHQSVAARLQAIQRQPQSVPLFDAATQIKHWEAAMRRMVERSRSGLKPQAFDV